jgi:hypothetical protein
MVALCNHGFRLVHMMQKETLDKVDCYAKPTNWGNFSLKEEEKQI